MTELNHEHLEHQALWLAKVRAKIAGKVFEQLELMPETDCMDIGEDDDE